MKYGIRVVTTYWACQNGGDDHTGTQEEMQSLVNTWKREQNLPNVKYTVIPYHGEDGKPPFFPGPPDNPRNSRMKR